MSRLRPSFSVYLRLVSAAGVALLLAMLVGEAGSFGPLHLEFWLLAALVLLGELYPIQVHGRTGEETFSTPFGFAMLLIYGAPEVALVQALSSLTADVLRRRPADRAVFNLAQLTLSWGAAGAALALAGGTGLERGASLEADELPAIALSAIAFFVVNSTLVRSAEAFQQGLAVGPHLVADLLFRSWSAGTLFVLGPPVAVIAESWLYLVPALALPMAALHVASQQASEMERLALYDQLTGLPNRSLLSLNLAQALSRAQTGRHDAAVLVLDLDRFRDVNDTLGRPQGDALLMEIGERLDGSSGADTVARVGADEFGVLLAEIADRAEAEARARELLGRVSLPVEVAGASLSVDASCGIAMSPEHGSDPALLLQHAEAAMYQAKRAQSRLEFYSREMDQEAPRRLLLVTSLKRAIDARSIELHYQPKIELASRRVVGVEALARWTDPGLGSVPPGVFVPLTEMTGLAGPFTQMTLEMATEDARRFRDAGCPVPVALNVSPRVLLDPGFPRSVEAQLRRAGLDGSTLLEIEITESTLMEDHEAARAALANLRAIGVRTSIDDFGTGYSSLAYLRELTVYALKIDQAFVSRLGEGGEAEAILKSIIELARGLGLETVAEGVEDMALCDRLAALGCDSVQGFALARPMPAGEVLEWILARREGVRGGVEEE